MKLVTMKGKQATDRDQARSRVASVFFVSGHHRDLRPQPITASKRRVVSYFPEMFAENSEESLPFRHLGFDHDASVLDSDLVPCRDHGRLNRRKNQCAVFLSVETDLTIRLMNRIATRTELDECRVGETAFETRNTGLSTGRKRGEGGKRENSRIIRLQHRLVGERRNEEQVAVSDVAVVIREPCEVVL